MIRRLPSPRTLSALALLALMGATVAVAIDVPGERRLDDLPGAAQPDFTTHLALPEAAVDDAFVASIVGGQVFSRVVGAAPRPVLGRPGPPVAGAPTPARAAPSGPSVRPGGATRLLAPGSWDLRLAFAPDRTLVRTGERFTYVITVSNVGRERFAGVLRLDWHVPLNTRATAPCLPDLAVLCPILATLFLAPGIGLDGTLGLHLYSSSAGVAIDPGATYVHIVELQVNEVVPAGTVLTNHAHLGVGGGGTGTVTAEAARVVVGQGPAL